MNRLLVTGSTGFLGRQLVIRLAGEGNIVHALFRSEEKILGWEHENTPFFKGTRGDIHSLDMAALATTWARDSEGFYEENVQGTKNVLATARKLGVEKRVYTSTAGVFRPSTEGNNTEEKPIAAEHFTDYDRPKAMAEEMVREFVEGGLTVVILNPTRIFGPGNLSKINGLTMMKGKYLKGKWRIIPGDGKSFGNYVYVEDVVDCHLLAMEKGKSGERYLVAGENLSFKEFFNPLRKLSRLNYRLYKIPVWAMMLVSWVFLRLANISGWMPTITPSFVRRYKHNWATILFRSRMV